MNGASIICLMIIAIVVIYIAYKMIKRLFSKETCCGTERVSVRRKKLRRKSGKYVLRVSGMKCSRCKAAAENAVNAIDGLSARVDLEHKTITVFYEDEPKKEAAVAVIEACGYIVSE